MKNSSKEILEELRGDNRERMMIYLDKNLQSEFKKFCLGKKVRMSKVIERLIERFLADLRARK